MTYRMLQLMLLSAPLAAAAVVGLRMPRADAGADANDAATLAHACEASHRVQGAPASHEDGRPTQAPAWQQAQRAAVERCLRDALQVVRTARAATH